MFFLTFVLRSWVITFRELRISCSDSVFCSFLTFKRSASLLMVFMYPLGSGSIFWIASNDFSISTLGSMFLSCTWSIRLLWNSIREFSILSTFFVISSLYLRMLWMLGYVPKLLIWGWSWSGQLLYRCWKLKASNFQRYCWPPKAPTSKA